MDKKTLFFTLDALLATMIIISGVILAGSFYIHYKSNTNVEFISEDILNVISELRVGEVNNSLIQNLTANNSITDLNTTVLEQIGIFWSRNQTNLSRELAQSLVEDVVPETMGFGLYIDGESIYVKNISISGDLVKSSSFISGIEKTKPVEGYIAKVYLQGIDSRVGYSYAYFGGYEGEGNITKRIELPTNFTVEEAVMELDAGTHFKLYINGYFAGAYPVGSGGGSYLKPDRWVINNTFYQHFKAGVNNITLKFTDINGNLTANGPKYISGGFIRVKYTTNSLTLLNKEYNNDTVNTRYYFPGISGFINLFSSFDVPGKLKAMKIRLHYKSNYTTFLNLGNITVYQNKTNYSIQDITLSNDVISGLLNNTGKNYSIWSYVTVPLRLGLVNVSMRGAPADIILDIDVSGSMSSDYMESSWHRLDGATLFREFTVDLPAGGETRLTVNLPNESFIYESVDVSATGLNNGNVDLWVTPPGEPEQRAQCDEDPGTCSSVDFDNDEYYHRSYNIKPGNWSIRVRSSITQQVHVKFYTSKIDGARSASDEFVRSTLANEGPLIGLVNYSGSTQSTLALTDNISLLTQTIDKFGAYGGTCICCGINSAVALLSNSANATLLIPRKSSGWRYNDNNLATEPTNWKELNFDDSSWSQGTGVFRNNYWTLGNPSTIINRYGGDYYFRRKFNITQNFTISSATLSILSDNGADVYINGVLVDHNYGSSGEGNAQYWNRIININTSLLHYGENILAAKLYNQIQCWWFWCWSTNVAFDAELGVSFENNITEYRPKIVVLMTDGQANVECSEQGVTPDLNGDGLSDRAEDDAIKAACDAYDDYGIIFYTVGFGEDADENTLKIIANCSNGKYYNSNNTEQLIESFREIQQQVLKYSNTQVANLTNIVSSFLYPDSYIEYNYTPVESSIGFGRIPITIETPVINNTITQGSIFIPSDVALEDFVVTSYSADKWTSDVIINNSDAEKAVFNLSLYNKNFQYLGDAYKVMIPADNFRLGEYNNITIHINDALKNASSGSPSDRFIYTVWLRNSVDYSDVLPRGEGCNWSVNFEDGTGTYITIPESYNGTKKCYYYNASYDIGDAVDSVVYNLLNYLDFDNDGLLEVKIGADSVKMDSLAISKVPTMWGPSEIQTRVWK